MKKSIICLALLAAVSITGEVFAAISNSAPRSVKSQESGAVEARKTTTYYNDCLASCVK
ncbi:MAG: hypothetical protein LBO78_00885 [Rickettsiales bacterium]|nr:hypothetical protein [Rickettsiales bacterium]